MICKKSIFLYYRYWSVKDTNDWGYILFTRVAMNIIKNHKLKFIASLSKSIKRFYDWVFDIIIVLYSFFIVFALIIQLSAYIFWVDASFFGLAWWLIDLDQTINMWLTIVLSIELYRLLLNFISLHDISLADLFSICITKIAIDLTFKSSTAIFEQKIITVIFFITLLIGYVFIRFYSRQLFSLPHQFHRQDKKNDTTQGVVIKKPQDKD